MAIIKRDNTPKELTGSVRAFCRSISAHKPVLLPYTDVGYGYQATYCHDNIWHYVTRHGGTIYFGWQIWANTRFKLEAEHHSVWQSPTGKLYDISPRQDGEELILFLPDPERPYDFDSQIVWCNRHNDDRLPRFVCHGQVTKEERVKAVFVGEGLAYRAWLRDLPGNPAKALE